MEKIIYNKKEIKKSSNIMDTLEIILDELKLANNKANSNAIYYSDSIDGKNKRYYLKTIDLNFYKSPLLDKKYKAMYLNGTGKELLPRFFKEEKSMACKMQSLRSSSAMIFNTLGFDDHFVSIKSNSHAIPKGDYDVNFEHQFKVLNNKVGEKFPANINATLISDKLHTAVLIESKMLEYMFYDDEIKVENKYFDKNQYYDCTKEFCTVFEKCKKMNFKFDYPQLLKHLIGFCNKLNTYKKINKIILVTVVWNVLEPEALFKNNEAALNLYKKKWENESNESKLSEINRVFSEIINKNVTVFRNKQIDFEFKFLTFKEFLELINYSKDKNRFEYLKKKYIF